MKSIYLLLSVLLFASCGNNPKTKVTETVLLSEEVADVKEKLDTTLVKGILKLVQSNEHLKYPEIPLNESFITIGFLRGNPSSDSTVTITYFHNNFDPFRKEINYKGMLNIDNYNVAIFDVGNFGDIYYNADSLKRISLEGFKLYPMKDIHCANFQVRNGKLIYRGLWVIPEFRPEIN